MKHIALLTTLLLSASLQAVEKPYDYVFFENSLMKGDYFYSQAKYTSPSWIKNARHHLPVDLVFYAIDSAPPRYHVRRDFAYEPYP